MIFEPDDWIWLYIKKEQFPSKQKTKLNQQDDSSSHVLKKINDNVYQINLLDEYNVSVTFNVIDFSLTVQILRQIFLRKGE